MDGYFAKLIGGTSAAATDVARVASDWDTIRAKDGPLSLDRIYARHNADLTAAAAAASRVIFEHIAPVCNSLNLSNADGTFQFIKACPGEIISLMHILSNRSLKDGYMTANTQDGAIDMLAPLWIAQYPFDAEDYSISIEEMGPLAYTRQGATLWQLVGSDVVSIIAEGQQRPASAHRRQWIMVPGTDDVLKVPPGRYHFGAILNEKAAGANTYDSGLTIDGPNIHVPDLFDGRNLQRLFCRDYLIDRGVVSAAAAFATVEMPTDDCVQAGGIEDIMQPIFWGRPGQMQWKEGVRGPFTITKAAADPAMVGYFLKCDD